MADKTLNIEIVTPQKVVYKGTAESVSLPGSKSPFQVLYNHAPIVSSLELGLIKLSGQGHERHYFATSEGFAEISNNKISVLVENADDASNLEREQVEAEIEKRRHDLENAIEAYDKDRHKKLLRIAKNKLKALDKHLNS